MSKWAVQPYAVGTECTTYHTVRCNFSDEIRRMTRSHPYRERCAGGGTCAADAAPLEEQFRTFSHRLYFVSPKSDLAVIGALPGGKTAARTGCTRRRIDERTPPSHTYGCSSIRPGCSTGTLDDYIARNHPLTFGCVHICRAARRGPGAYRDYDSRLCSSSLVIDTITFCAGHPGRGYSEEEALAQNLFCSAVYIRATLP